MDSHQMKIEHLQELDKQINNNRAVAAAATDLEHLVSSQAFDKVIRKGYFVNEAVRLTSLLADPAMQTPEKQAGVIEQLKAISHFQEYVRIQLRQGDMARKSIADAQQQIEEVSAE